MLLNEKSVLKTPVIELHPYLKEHVERYHAWMSDPEIRALTASEPLTLREEYEMQQSWQQDPDKLTFIIVLPQTEGQSMMDCMIGDVNMFLSPVVQEESDKGVHGRDTTAVQQQYNGELELMIAEPGARRQGHGKAALRLFMAWIQSNVHQVVPEGGGDLVSFSVKIGADNAASLALFQGIGFRAYKYSAYFREEELRMALPDPAVAQVAWTEAEMGSGSVEVMHYV